jgi:hypothetical protein
MVASSENPTESYSFGVKTVVGTLIDPFGRLGSLLELQLVKF